jgi:hypothetical protein
MTTDPGGWTGITVEQTSNGDLDAFGTAIESAPEQGIDMMCRVFTADAEGDHSYTLQFPPVFDEFYLSNYPLLARAVDPNLSEIQDIAFVQTSWDDATEIAESDVSFGSTDETGSVTLALASRPKAPTSRTRVACTSCEQSFPSPNTQHAVPAQVKLHDIADRLG